jgi:hypothetical protein
VFDLVAEAKRAAGRPFVKKTMNNLADLGERMGPEPGADTPERRHAKKLNKERAGQ